MIECFMERQSLSYISIYTLFILLNLLTELLKAIGELFPVDDLQK